MNPNNAIQFAKLVEAAYTVAPNDLSQPAVGTKIPDAFDPFKRNYTIASKIYGNDLATDVNSGRGQSKVSFGYVLQDDGGNVVVAIRGTEEIWEWL